MKEDEINPANSHSAVNENKPWLGLLPYEEDDSALFYGRGAETVQLSRLIKRAALTVLFGRSGTGKSSLLNAGVFPELREDRYLPVWIRLNYSEDCRHDQLIRSAVERAVVAADLEGEILNEPIGKDEETVWEFLHRVEYWDRRNQPVIPVLVFDQFEELFTLGDSHGGDQGFIEGLADLVQNYIPQSIRDHLKLGGARLPPHYSTQRYKIVITLREDFVARLDELRKSMPLVMHNRFYLKEMNGEQALEVVLGPGGDLVEESVAREIVQFVSASLKGETHFRGGGDDSKSEKVDDLKSLQIEPALLSLVCRELNQRRIDRGANKITLEQVMGSREDILEGFYESSLDGLEVRDRIFIEDRLVTASGFRSTVPVEDAEIAGLSTDDIEVLVNRRLIRREERLGTPHIELTHDVLTSVVTRSRNERQKQEQAIEEQRLKTEEVERLALARQLRAKKQRRYIAIVSVFSIVMAFFAAGLFISRKNAIKFSKQAEARYLSLNAMEQSKLDPELGLLLGIEAAMIGLTLNESSESIGGVALETDKTLRIAMRRSMFRTGFYGSGMKAHDGPVYSVDFHPKRQVALSSGNYKDATVKLWDIDSGELLATLDHEGISGTDKEKTTVSVARFNPEGNKIVTATYRDGGYAHIWDVGALIDAAYRKIELENEIMRATGGEKVKALEQQLAVVSEEKKQLEEADPTVTFEGHVGKSSWVTAAAFNHDGTVVATGAQDNFIRLWDPVTGDEIPESPLDYHSRRVRSVDFNVDSSKLLSTSDDGTSAIWKFPPDIQLPSPEDEPVKTEPLRSLNPFDGSDPERINGGQFNPAGNLIATVDNEKFLRIWDSDSGNMLAEFRHPDIPLALDFYRNDRIVTVCNDSTVRFFSIHYPSGIAEGLPVRNIEMIGSQRGHKGRVRSIAVDPTNNYVLTGGEDSSVRLWKQPPGGEISVLKSTETLEGKYIEQTDRVFWSTDIFDYKDLGLIAYSGNHLGQVNAWNVFKERILSDWKASHLHDNAIRSLNLNRSGTQFVTGSSDQTAIVWDAENGKPLMAFTGHRKVESDETSGGTVYQARYSNNDTKIVSASSDGTARVWSVSSTDAGIKDVKNSELIVTPGFRKFVRADVKDLNLFVKRLTDEDTLLSRELKEVIDVPDLQSKINNLESKSVQEIISDQLNLLLDKDWSNVAIPAVRERTQSLKDLDERSIYTNRVLNRHLIEDAFPNSIRRVRLQVYDARFSEDDTMIVTANLGLSSATVWNAETGEQIAEFKDGHADIVLSAAFSPNGLEVVTACTDGKCRVWSVATGEVLASLNHNTSVRSAEFNSNGDKIITAAEDGNIRRWKRSTGQLLGVQKDHDTVATRAGIRSNSEGKDTYIITEGIDGNSTVSYMDPWAVYHLANRRVTRKLTLTERNIYGVERQLTDNEISYYRSSEPENLEFYLKHGTLPDN